MDYREAKLRQLDAATTYRVYGHEIEFKQGAAGSKSAAARLRWRLIGPCFCVQDSPESPCPCMHDGWFLWWLREDAVVREGKSGRKDHEGKELQFFDVLVDSQIMVESLQPVSTGALKGLGDAISPQRVRELVSSSAPAAPQTIAFEIPWDRIKQFVRDNLPADWVDLWDELGDALDALGKPVQWPPHS
jgi:hypothetical protein